MKRKITRKLLSIALVLIAIVASGLSYRLGHPQYTGQLVINGCPGSHILYRDYENTMQRLTANGGVVNGPCVDGKGPYVLAANNNYLYASIGVSVLVLSTYFILTRTKQ